MTRELTLAILQDNAIASIFPNVRSRLQYSGCDHVYLSQSAIAAQEMRL
ncbi:MAG TPA: hypothetical protein V6D14_28540 [Coleofasciculaceae cyanobacterium]